ncbi:MULTISPECIES: dihydroneopterin aldolase [Psychrilyobacter]|uniref:7,8-dihydroneopterin aldolase n=1 Tax=Psychrilyobacter piezotolerans TaxID=2293438 RepID=A0ABX9KHY6_9FUSO|nr:MULTISPECIES: dihydroneopterin aldolase [Psychrilyobacter]MCS5421190.1 dihydroneopterin aldolase [Psychrilyobacter sp. S5]NDI77619.1 dihydroneopterin aldolase [Psychrilyobacter piezotolerans]RDE62628.1 dihydroneopterin aldolase [Psychrilyobacter sp. S5]REI41558.1 dihydroneopterin aldolase [Psychrilyobacter piezotolerans]
MDKIIVKNIKAYGYHGALTEENILGQNFYADVTLYKSLKKAGLTDDLSKSISYVDVYYDVEDIIKNKKFKLIEALAEMIAHTLLVKYGIEKVEVEIRKPGAPINGSFDYVGVGITREAKNYEMD